VIRGFFCRAGKSLENSPKKSIAVIGNSMDTIKLESEAIGPLAV
jgi:hypothetical protein